MEKIKETIKYYIVQIYYNTIYLHYMYNIEILKKKISRSDTIEEAMSYCNKKTFNWIPKSYKKKLVDEKFSRIS